MLDGQHRAEGARRAGIRHVPAVVVAAGSIAEQANAFVRANLDRVSVNGFALYHARLVAGDAEAAGIDRLCRKAGIVIPKYPIPSTKLKPGETMALATIGALLAKSGEDFAELVLRTVVAGTAARPGQIRAPLIRAVAEILGRGSEAQRRREAGAIEGFLKRTAPRDIAAAAAARRAEGEGDAASLVAVLERGMKDAPAPSPAVNLERPGRVAVDPPAASTVPAAASPRRIETKPPVSADAAAIAEHVASKGVTKIGDTDSPDVDQVLAEVRRTGDVVVPTDASFASFTLNGTVPLNRQGLLKRANAERVRKGLAPWREHAVRWVRPTPEVHPLQKHQQSAASRAAAAGRQSATLRARRDGGATGDGGAP